MNTNDTAIELGTVHQGSYTSRARDHYGADASTPITLFSDQNVWKVRSALLDYRGVGANQFGAATFGSTPFRATQHDSDWRYDLHQEFELPHEYAIANERGIRVATEVSGKPVPALIAPVTDTIGRHDSQWQSLGSNQRAWAIQRHEPQFKYLVANKHVSGIWVEAMRYLEEAAALAELCKEYEVRLLVVAFRLESNGDFPDSEHPSTTLLDAQSMLQEIAKNRNVVTGINCTGATAVMNRVGDAEDIAGVVYPNTNDYAKGLANDSIRLEELYKLGALRSADENAELAEIEARLRTSRPEFESAWRIARLRDPRCVISACCGATPEIIKWASEFHNRKM